MNFAIFTDVFMVIAISCVSSLKHALITTNRGDNSIPPPPVRLPYKSDGGDRRNF